MATLIADIDANTSLIRVSGANLTEPRLRFRLDDELLDLYGWDRRPLSGGYRAAGLDTTRWLVARGVAGTTKASHSAGVTIKAAASASVSSNDIAVPIPFPTVSSSHPDLATHDTLGLATQAELNTHAATTHGTTIAALPSAGVGHRGKLYLVAGGAGVADELYVCVKDDSDAYVWFPLLWTS